MNASSPVSAERLQQEGKAFVAAANAAMRRASRAVIAENKRFGLPLIAEKRKRCADAPKKSLSDRTPPHQRQASPSSEARRAGD